MKRTLFASFLMLLFFTQLSFGTSILKNGSFERGTEFWENTITDLCVAKFIPDRVFAADGLYSLRASVTKINTSNPKGVSASNRVNLPQNDSIYLLRFRAKSYSIGNALDDKMDMNVYVECGDTTYKVRFVVRHGSYLYHLPFKTHSKNVNIRFAFPIVGTYYIDAVELIAENNDVGIDVQKTYIWNNNRKQSWQWVAGDNDVSLKLPDGRTMWFFNDSFYGKDSPADNQVYPDRFLRNALVVEGTDGILTSRWNGDQKTADIFFPVEDTILVDGKLNNLYWVGDAFFDPKESKVKIYLVDLTQQGGIKNTGKTYIGEFSYPSLKYLGAKKQAPSMHTYETYLVENDTLFMYRSGNGGTHVARTPMSNILGDKEHIQYFDGASWTTDSLKSIKINNLAADAVVKFAEGNYAQITGGMLSAYVEIAYAQHPQGPWSPKQNLYRIPSDSTFTHYMPNFHGLLPDGKMSISYSVNCSEDWGPCYRNKLFYRQHYIQADLMALSPFTRKDCAGVINGSAYLDDCKECVAGTTGKTPCVTGPAVVYPDCGFSGLPVALEAGSYPLKTLQSAGINDNDIASIKVMNGYRLDLYSENNYTGDKMTLTSDSSCLYDAGFTDRVTSLTISQIGIDTISGWFKIRNAQNGLYLDSEDGIPFKDYVVQNALSNAESQAFHLADPLNGFYTISTYNGKAIQTGSSVDGALLDLKLTIPSSYYQQFAIKMVGADSVKFINRKIDKLLEGIPGMNPGSSVRMWSDFEQLSGIWILEPTLASALVENKSSDKISVSPNPVQNTMYLYGINEGSSIKLVNLQGQVVLSQNRYSNLGVDVSFLSKGVYILNVTQGEQINTLKVLIK